MNKKKILLLGNGGHCRSVIDTLISLNTYDEIGIVEKYSSNIDNNNLIVGSDDDLPTLFDKGWREAFITVGSVGNTRIRESLYLRLKELDFEMPSIIDPSAVVSQETQIEEGVFIGKRAVINTGAKISSCAIINTGAIVEHDCIVGKFTHISPGSVLCGQATVGNFSHIGAGSVVRQQISIGDRVLIGAGSVVVKDLPSEIKAFGNPCRIIT
ncbi:MAG: acetyltransferase [Saccharofermentans sp.]|nr:acetyltransferase [Saccharofermentans sp.]